MMKGKFFKFWQVTAFFALLRNLAQRDSQPSTPSAMCWPGDLPFLESHQRWLLKDGSRLTKDRVGTHWNVRVCSGTRPQLGERPIG